MSALKRYADAVETLATFNRWWFLAGEGLVTSCVEDKGVDDGRERYEPVAIDAGVRRAMRQALKDHAAGIGEAAREILQERVHAAARDAADEARELLACAGAKS